MKETTGKRLKKIMSDRDIKQVDILRMCEPYCQKYGVKLAKNDLSQYINDKVQPRQDKLSILGMALGVSEAWLMGFDVDTASEPENSEAMQLYQNYMNAAPNIQAAVRALLGSDVQDP